MSQPAQQAAVQRRAANAAVQQPAVQQPQVSATADYVKKMSAQWAKVLPAVCTPERFARVALSCLNGNQKLAAALQTQTGMVSLSSALMKCAEVGLEPNGRDAHLIPFNTKQGVQIQLIIDYKGLVKLARRSGEISTIVAETVHKSDKFQFSYTEGVICHEPNFDVADPGEAYAWYVKVTFKDGSTQTKMMRKFQIEEIRKRSRSANDGPWVTDYDAMALKTVFKQVSKWLPNESEKFDEVNKAIQYDNEDERGPIDVTPHNSRFAGNAQQAPAGSLLGALGVQQTVVQTAEAQNVPQNDAANVQPQQPQQQAAPQDPDAEINARLAAAKAPVSYNDIREWYEVENGRWDANDVLANLDACISKTLDFKDSANQPQ
ncbi:MAG: recombinase RecT [Victivallales bacterium]|nr:recombinase RecT [Victivallales bacterium]